MIQNFAQDNPRDWDKQLPLVVMATHAMVHSETGFSPNQLMLGQEVLMPSDLLMGNLVNFHQYEPSEWVKVQSEIIPKIYHMVRQNLKGTLARHKKDYDLWLSE